MVKQSEEVAHAELVSEAETTKHFHPGGGNGFTGKAGSESMLSAGDYLISFTTAFADANYSVSLSPSDTAKDPRVQWKNKTASGFTVAASQDGGGGFISFVCDWIAIPHNDP